MGVGHNFGNDCSCCEYPLCYFPFFTTEIVLPTPPPPQDPSIRWTLKHYIPATCYLKAWVWRYVTDPPGQHDHSQYLWSNEAEEGSCIDFGLSYTAEANIIVGPSYILRSRDGGFSIKKISCLPGYEPDDPDEQGRRPVPDPRSNGFPSNIRLPTP